jgi:predicted nucleotide-binding protein (sugar kinase/HSP70/actin superfamily)
MSEQQSLKGRLIYLPEMAYGSARCVAAAFQSVGLDAAPTPASSPETLKLGSRFTSGDECLPERITLGDFLRIAQRPGFEPQKTAFFMPTAGGPCRFGQYEAYLKKVMRQLGYGDILIFSPTSANSYSGIGDSNFTRTAWRAFVAADLLQKLRLKTRPYETEPGATNEVYEQALREVCEAIAAAGDNKQRMARLLKALTRARDQFRRIPVRRNQLRPIIGIVGEIFCRHHTFSNENLIEKLEEHGGEAWISDLSEWIWYAQESERRGLARTGRTFSKAMLRNRIVHWIQSRDEHALLKPFHEDLAGYEEPDIVDILNHSEPYLPAIGSHGEMVTNVGKTICLCRKGVDGVIDISPFTCMNGIVCEAVYPKVSRDHGGFPIRSFYFDGTATDLDRDLGIFIELARNYQRKRQARAEGN